ncbi:MAG: hypothetical protein WA641_17815, partial [Candidatus Acidiferrales bacterium]
VGMRQRDALDCESEGASHPFFVGGVSVHVADPGGASIKAGDLKGAATTSTAALAASLVKK